jgi:hypothetical protein
MISSFLMFFFYVYEIRILRKKGVKEIYLDLLSLTSFFFAGGVLFIGIFPLHLTVLHTISALFYFAGGFGFMMIYGFIVLKHSEISNTLAFAAFTTAACYLLYFLSPVISVYTSSFGITKYFLEWLTLITKFLMMVIIIIQQFLIDEKYYHVLGTKKVKIR